MGRQAKERFSLFVKCHCGSKGEYIINGGAEHACRIHYDELIMSGKIVPSSHYITADGYKVFKVYKNKVETNITYEGKKLFLLCGEEYELIKV